MRLKYLCFKKTLFLSLLLTECSQEYPAPKGIIETITGRDNGSYPYHRDPLWRIRKPGKWIRKDSLSLSIQDSRIAIAEFAIEDEILISLHSFPYSKEEDRIPPMAQVYRWKAQFDSTFPLECTLSNQAFSGYVGVLLDGRGTIKGKSVRMLAWALSLSPRGHSLLGNGSNSEKISELRSAITIKALGDERSMDQHEDEIRTFARSFELIEAIP